MSTIEEPLVIEELRGHVGVLQARIQELENMVRDLAMAVSASPAGSGAARPLDAPESTVRETYGDGNKSPAYTIRRVINPESPGPGEFVSVLVVNDKGLILLLKAAIEKYPGIDFEGDVLIIPSPFPVIVHNWDSLSEHAARASDDGACGELAALLCDIKQVPELQDCFRTHDPTCTTFDTLWMLFPPGKLIVARPFMDVPQIFRIEDSLAPHGARSRDSHYRIWAWQWDWDGNMMIKVHYKMSIPRFQGSKRVVDLPFYPLPFHNQPDPDTLCAYIRKRSLLFINTTIRADPGVVQVRLYTGYAYGHAWAGSIQDGFGSDDEPRSGHSRSNEASAPSTVQIDGEFVCDHRAFLEYGAEKPPLGNIWHRDQIRVDPLQASSEDAVDFENTLTALEADEELDRGEENFLLLPPRLLGYATRDKTWAQFNIARTRPALGKQAKKFQEVLQISDTGKYTLEALIMSSDGDAGQGMTDAVESKGGGTVILLHGPPGVGKSLTAETIAEAAGKPLLVISVAEIGLNPVHAEKNLNKFYTLARKWGCILLLDEADVYLEQRTRSDIERNSLVSVFLKVLEYSTGILFLTTNRVGTLDEAFRSRIHLSMYYPTLNQLQTVAIWKTNIDRVEALNNVLQNNEKEPVEFDRIEILDWVKRNWEILQWNGRQIRNAFQTVAALAKFEANSRTGDPRRPVLKAQHFEIIGDISMQFKKYLSQVHGADEEERALRDALRTDFISTRPPKNKWKKPIKLDSDSETSESRSESEALSQYAGVE